jgi:hypothetical protein
MSDKSVKELLTSYRHNKSRIEVLEVKIAGLKKQLEYNNQTYTEPERETIEGMATPAAVIDDMPKAITNVNSDPTARIALTYRDNIVNTNEIDTIDIKLEIARCEAEKEQLEAETKLVDAMMMSLTAEQKLIIQKFYIEGMIWRYVANEYNTRFGEFREKKTLLQIRDAAIAEMEKVRAGN